MITEEIRSYEVSIWTLQDEFLTVLKWSDAENKGTIENPKMVLNIDGTQTFDFSIPMYYYYQGKLIDNPGWYNTLNGNLLEGLRKIKVIFNKEELSTMSISEFEAAAPFNVFEFLIMKMTDNHEKDIATCDVKCEGLAFHELGKVGYKISLSQENFEIKYKKWVESDRTEPEPLQTIDYWCGDKTTCNIPIRPLDESIIDPNTWYYKVCMDQKSFKDGATTRSSAKVYEEPYPTAWNTTTLIPTDYKEYQEKARAVNADKSNLYNLTQTIAEAFQVHCRYKYTYDENYHITSRTIVFYNHFFQEEEGAMSFTYPYSSSKITRDSDCSSLTTKLYVLTTDNDRTVVGYNTIMNASANPTHEDYILNFDYMLDRGIISQDQYDAIKPYEIAMYNYNEQLIGLQQNLATYSTQKPNIEAKVVTYKRSIGLDEENIAQNQALKNALDMKDADPEDGFITIDEYNPDMRIVQKDKNESYYINLATTNKGIQTDTVHIYRHYNGASHNFPEKIPNTDPEEDNEITDFTFEYDEYERPCKIRGITPRENSSGVYLTYKYDPQLYYDAVVKVWETKLNTDKERYGQVLSEIGPESENDIHFDLEGVYSFYAKNMDNITHKKYEDATTSEKEAVYAEAYAKGLNKKIKDTTEQIEDLIDQKNAEIKEFERLMGAALREGYWQPEDYKDYGINKEDTKALTILTDEQAKEDTEESFIAFWDAELFEEENKNYYEESVNLNKVYYPCIDLSSIYDDIKDSIMSYSFIFNNNYIKTIEDEADTRYTQIFSIGSGALLEFGKNTEDHKIHPLLVLVGAKSMSNTSEHGAFNEIAFMKSKTHVENEGTENEVTVQGGNPRLGIVGAHTDGTYELGDTIDVSELFVNGQEYITVYPRIKFSSLNLRSDSSDMIIKYEDNLLEIAQDYTVQTRDTLRTVNGADQYYSEYFITVKPDTIYKCKSYTGDFNIHYILSNADNQIYLDALEISKENAYPKVEYTVAPNILNRDLSKTLYQKLATLVMINDVKLKLENVFGYISKVELDLDNVSKDQVEVKNYTSKFEDLFSAIVAQTEQMKQDNAQFHAAVEGNIPLSGTTLHEMIIQQKPILQEYLDSYFDSSQVVRDRLTELFTEAGEILSDSNKALNKVRALTLDNVGILQGFAQNVAQELTTKVYRQAEKPGSFKPGDIWIDDNGNRWIATSFSEEADGGTTSGFVRTRDGTLASITGASININADDGIIDILAQNELNLKSNGLVYIAAGDMVEIVGNNKVNIGGTEINLCSLAEKKLNPLTGEFEVVLDENDNEIVHATTGINLIAGEYQASGDYGTTSRVLIKPTKIEMGASELILKAASKINLIASTGDIEGTSAIELDADKGVYIGAGRGVKIFGGTGVIAVYVGPNHPGSFKKGDYWIKTSTVPGHTTYSEYYKNILLASGDYRDHFTVEGTYKATDDYTSTDIYSTSLTNWTAVNNNPINIAKEDASTGKGASIELNQEHLLLGFANVTNQSLDGSAIEMTDEYMVMAVGSRASVVSGGGYSYANKNVTGASGGLIGAKFTKESIGFATQGETLGTFNAIIMNSKGVTLGSDDGGIDLANSTKEQLRDYFNEANKAHGSYVRVAPEGIELGSMADLYVNTSNFKLQTHSRDKGNVNFTEGETILAIGSNLQAIDYNTQIVNGVLQDSTGTALPTTGNNAVNVRLLVNKNGVYVKGSVTATSFRLTDTSGYTMTISYALDTQYVSWPTNVTTYAQRPTTAEITTYANTLSEANKENIYLWTKITTTVGQEQSQSTYACEHVNADGTLGLILIDYTTNSTASVPSNATWVKEKPSTTVAKPFLITRTRTFQNYTWTTTYSFSKLTDDDQPYVISIKTLYWLKATTNPTNLSSGTHAEVTNTTNGKDQWTLVVPTYDGTATNLYTYYTCQQTKWANHTPTLEWTAPVENYGLTIANQHATAASKAAADAATSVDPIVTFGLDSNVTWNGKTYALALGNNKTEPMLIGSNGGVTIVDTNLSSGQSGFGSAVVLQGGGIGMHGSSIVLTTSNDGTVSRHTSQGGYTTTSGNTTINALVLDNEGIVMGTNGNIQLLSNNFRVRANPSAGQEYFYVGESGNNPSAYIKYKKAAAGESSDTFEVKGKIVATELTIGNKNAAQFVADNAAAGVDLSNYATYSDFIVAQGSSATGAARISASVWNTMGTGTSLKMTDGTLQIGTTSGNTFTSSVSINNNGIVLASNKTLQINTTNFTIDSNGDVTVKGTIEADYGSIAGWTLGPEFLRTGTDSDKGLMVTLVGANATRHNDIITHPVGEYNTNYQIGDNNNLTIELNKWAIYAGAMWPEDAPGYAPYQTPARGGTGDDKDLGWAPFRVKRNGETYIKDLCIGNGPSTLGTNTVSYEYWSGYEGHMWFWVKGTDGQGKRCYKWIEIDGQALYNMLEDVATLWNRTIGGGTYAKSTTNEIAVATNTQNSSGGCFIKGTLVHLANGQLIPIETLQLGMKVLSYDTNTQQFCAKEVMTVQAIRHKNQIYDLYLSNGKIITVTNSHPFLTTDGWKAIDPEWAWHDHKVETTILQENDELINISNNKIYIKKILYRTDLQDETVYSCGIEDTHTFIVEGVVVHNVFVATALKS